MVLDDRRTPKTVSPGAENPPHQPRRCRVLWVETVHRSHDTLAEVLSRGGLEQTTHDGMSPRRLRADMIEEHAHRTGHADLLREQVGGATGEGPPNDFPVP